MNIKDYKHVVISGPEDGQTVAMLVDKTAYLIQCDGLSDAFRIMERKYGIFTGDWMLSRDKAVLIPGVWEYEMAVCIKDMDSLQVEELAQQLRDAGDLRRQQEVA